MFIILAVSVVNMFTNFPLSYSLLDSKETLKTLSKIDKDNELFKLYPSILKIN